MRRVRFLVPVRLRVQALFEILIAARDWDVMPLYTNGVGYVAAAYVDCREDGWAGLVEKGAVRGEMSGV